VKKAVDNKVFANGTIDGYNVVAIKNEGELNVSKRLMSSVVKSHKNFIDIVVYDALACNSIWFNHCKNLGIGAIVRAKNNNNKSLRQVKKKMNKLEPVEVWNSKKGLEKVEIWVFLPIPPKR